MPTISPAANAASAPAIDQRAGKYLIFGLGREEFGVRVLKIREIMGLQEITAVPHTPAYVRGVINLRGKVIPVVDLRLKSGFPEMEYSARTCIVVVDLASRSGCVLIGMIVDNVCEVLNISAGDIENTPDFGHGGAPPYILGMAKIKGKVIILLDIDQVLNGGELQDLAGALKREL